MAGHDELLAVALEASLSGKGAHAPSQDIFDGLDWKLAGVRPAGAPHSIYQLLNHVTYWQAWVAAWLNGKTPRVPKHASGSWPGGVAPAGKREWDRAVKDFRKGLAAIERAVGEGDLAAQRKGSSRMEMIRAIASHNSYHLGQAVVLRQMLRAWPPPSGGVTW